MAWKDLSREEKIKHWETVEKKILNLLDFLGDVVPERDQAKVREFVDVNEFGLAFEQLVFGILEEGRALGGRQYAKIESLYRLFNGPVDRIDDAVMAKLKTLAIP